MHKRAHFKTRSPSNLLAASVDDDDDAFAFAPLSAQLNPENPLGGFPTGGSTTGNNISVL